MTRCTAIILVLAFVPACGGVVTGALPDGDGDGRGADSGTRVPVTVPLQPPDAPAAPDAGGETPAPVDAAPEPQGNALEGGICARLPGCTSALTCPAGNGGGDCDCNQGTWDCEMFAGSSDDAGTGDDGGVCPSTAPTPGDACDRRADVFCTYAVCGLLTLSCENGRWTKWEGPGCSPPPR